MNLPTRSLIVGLVAFVVVIGAYVTLTLAGQDTNGFLTFLGVLAGLVGLGGHNEVRLRRQDQTLAKIDKQTNGVLDGRIHQGARKAVRDALIEAGYNLVPEDVED